MFLQVALTVHFRAALGAVAQTTIGAGQLGDRPFTGVAECGRDTMRGKIAFVVHCCAAGVAVQ